MMMSQSIQAAITKYQKLRGRDVVQPIESFTNMHNTLGSILSTGHSLVIPLGDGKVEVGRSKTQGCPWPHSKFGASLVFMISFLKKKNNK